jgi:hypothetical protein
LRYITIVFLIPLSIFLFFRNCPAGEAKQMQVRIPFKSKTELTEILKLNPDIISSDDKSLEIIVDEEFLDNLRKLDLRPEIVHADLTAYYQSGLDPTLAMGGYKTLDELNAYLDDLVAAYPDIVSAKLNLGETVEGRPMWAVKISDNPNVEENDELEILYTAAIHAREVITPEVLIHFMDYLTENYPSDPEVAWLVDNRQMWFILCVNPDGYYYNEFTNPDGGGLWRKNRRDNGDGSFGVDLNRNFGYEWGHDNGGSSFYPGSETYRGTAAFSEPETQHIRDFVEAHNFIISIFFHSSGNQVLWPWCFERTYTPDNPAFAAMGDSIKAWNNYQTGTTPDILYMVNGGSDDWLYGEQTTKNKTLAMTFEVGPTFWPAVNLIDSLANLNLQPNLFLARILDSVFLPNPPAVPFAYVNDTAFIQSYDIHWSHYDSTNPAVDFDLEEYRDYRITTDSAVDLGSWFNNGFTSADSMSFTPPYSYYAGYGHGLRNYIRTQVPYRVPPGKNITFYAYYNIEIDYDYAYVEVSTDGINFTPIDGNLSTDENPHNVNRGHGITGSSGTWVQGVYDLSAFTGQDIYFRLSYYTDNYTLEEGIYFDNINPAGLFGFKTTYYHVGDTVKTFSNRPTDHYYYKVRARDAQGDVSEYSNMVFVSIQSDVICGDVNCSGGEPDISDITRLIDFLYISHNPLCNPQAADINGSGGEPDISDITALISFLYLSGFDLKC